MKKIEIQIPYRIDLRNPELDQELKELVNKNIDLKKIINNSFNREGVIKDNYI